MFYISLKGGEKMDCSDNKPLKEYSTKELFEELSSRDETEIIEIERNYINGESTVIALLKTVFK